MFLGGWFGGASVSLVVEERQRWREGEGGRLKMVCELFKDYAHVWAGV